jgi:hypothetical protein
MYSASKSSRIVGTASIRPGSLESFRSRSPQTLFYKLVVFFVLTVSVTMKTACVQSFRFGLSHSSVRSALFKCSRSNLCKVDHFKLREFSSSSISSSGNDAVDDVKNKLKKKASLLKRHVRSSGDGAALLESAPEKKDVSDSDVKMAKQAQDDLIAEYARTVSRIPTSIKVSNSEVLKAVDKKPSPVHKKKEKVSVSVSVTAQPIAEPFNSNSVYTNTEYKTAPPSISKVSSKDTEDYPDESFESSQLTTSVTNMAFNSLEVSVNTKRALSEVMKYK